MSLSISDFRREVRYPYAWPGGYPRFAVTDDGGCLCFACLRAERRLILEALNTPRDRSGWAVEGFDINWEDSELFCDNCSERIESAYAEPEDEDKSIQL